MHKITNYWDYNNVIKLLRKCGINEKRQIKIFYWDFFYDGGWYTRDGLLREEARKLIDGITDQEILIGINRCKNGKK